MKKLIAMSVVAVAVVGVVGVSASAIGGQANNAGVRAGIHQGVGQGGGYETSLESRAAVFGMSTEELKTALATKTMSQIAVERGISEEAFRAKMTEAAKARWEARGLSEEEIAERVADREARHATNSADHEFGSGEGNRLGGYGRNR